tara:strand:+ start:190 stop:2304 length:2115 start_codon:yes stop_codon:yes gene_type:complete
MLDDEQIASIVGFELSNSQYQDQDLNISLSAYLGDSIPPTEGRSSVVSTDIADAIEWIMPEVIKSFTQNNEIVVFDPVGPNDDLQAELESKLVYDVFMKQNNGFLSLYEFVKDALIQRNGYFKVFYSDDLKTTTEKYTNLTEIEYAMLISEDSIEVLEESSELDESGTIELYSVKISKTLPDKKLNVICVPPEEFRVNNMHNSVDLSTARFTAHLTLKTRSSLVASGYNKDDIWDLPSQSGIDTETGGQYRFTDQGEQTWDDSYDSSQDLIEIAECYMQLDINEDGIAELVKVTVSGWTQADTVLDVEPIDEIPFISGTAIIMPHKLIGLSIYDRLIQIQNQKTALWRNILDNMYLQNNQRMGVLENQVNLDDLMISRPGGIVRMKSPGALVPIVTPPLSADSYKMMDYLDQVRAGRSGVSPEGAITDTMVGNRVGSEGIAQMMNQKEELVGLMIRAIAETSIKPLMYMIRSQLIKHQDDVIDYKFRGQWERVDPKSWKHRTCTTVRVGTGTGNRQQQMSTLGGLRLEQKEMSAQPGQILVTPTQEYNLLNDIAKLGGFNGAESYFLDPQSPEGQQNAEGISKSQQEQQQKDEAKDMELVKAQIKVANAEESKAQTAGMNVQLTNDINKNKNMLQLQKQEADNEIKFLKQQLEEIKTMGDASEFTKEMEYKYWDRVKYYETEILRIQEMARAAQENNKDTSDGE